MERPARRFDQTVDGNAQSCAVHGDLECSGKTVICVTTVIGHAFEVQDDANCGEAAQECMTVGMTQRLRSTTQTVIGHSYIRCRER